MRPTLEIIVNLRWKMLELQNILKVKGKKKQL